MAQVPNVDVDFDGDGSRTIFDFDFPYQSAAEVFVSVDGVNVAYTFTSSSTHTVQVLPAPALGTKVRIYRSTLAFKPLHVFAAGVPFLPRYVDENNRQMLYVVQEGIDTSNSAQAEAIAATAIAKEALTTSGTALTNSEQAIRTADQAVVTAGEAVVTADDADRKADLAVTASDEAKTQAADADRKADDAVEKADAAVATADQAKATAEAISDTADAAFLAAGNAVVTADNALLIAQNIDAKATQALSNSTQAVSDAATALSTANAIDGKATDALAAAGRAETKADAAVATADAVDGKAQTAMDTAAEANTTAEQAAVTAGQATANVAAMDSRVSALETWRPVVEATLSDHANQLVSQGNALTTLGNRVTTLENLNLPNVPTAVSSGDNVTLALVNGEVWGACGEGGIYGQVAVGRGGTGAISASARFGVENFQRVPIPSASPVTKVFTSGKNSYALLTNGDLYAWGINSSGQLGLGHNAITGIPTLTAQNVLDFYADSTNTAYDGVNAKMYIRKTEGILATGYNAYGQLGVGDTTNRATWTMSFPVATGTAKLVFNLGSTHGCGVIITTDNRMFVCGRNDTGALGTGNGSNVYNWTNVTANWGGAAVSQITRCTGGFGHSDSAGYGNGWMAAYSEGVGLRVSGFGGYGAIGNGSLGNVTIPNNVALPSLPIDFVTTGDAPGQLFILGNDRNVYAWGYNNTDGQTGLGLTTITANVTKVTLPGTVSRLITRGSSAYAYSYACAMLVQLNDGSFWGWGNNRSGGVATGDDGTVTSPRRVLIPLREAGGVTLVPVHHVQMAVDQTGVQTNFLFTAAGYVYAWGYNGRSSLFPNNGTNSNERVPIRCTPPWRRKV